ncbi:MAG: RagB/SusD family nutrient uptake outer membrane protein [Cytophagales bacterium]|nr:RagB/SusD family nutrient uptake outer membrane protein [Cytophagales bacterium]
MRTNLIKNLLLSGAIVLAGASCTNDLERTPLYDVTSASVYNDFNNYRSVLGKLYAGYALTGQQGPDGRPDVGGIDEGASNYLRQYWQLQELPTDEAKVAWGDPDLPVLNTAQWSASNGFVRAMYYRVFYQITLANDFIRATTEDKLGSRGFSADQLADARRFHAEARFLRALSYWHALDMFGSVPFVTESDQVGAFFPKQASRAELFTFVESELLAIESQLAAPRQNEYGRADQAAAWTLLTKLYLNAPVYLGQAQNKYTEAVTYANKVISAGFALEPDYNKLFLTDNNTSPEIIFPITFDGTRTKSWGGMTFLVRAPIGGSMTAADFGVASGWGGLRTTKSIVNLFPDPSGNTDERANFYSEGQSLEINNLSTFTDGYGMIKFRNVSSTGQVGSDPGKDHVDTDFPMFRLADVYLMYAEAVLRGGTGGTVGQALQYVNLVRERAFNGTAGNITQGDLTLNFIIDERARELKWEAHRRTDLIRFGRFTGGEYLWPWKGGVKEGRALEPYRVLFPIPTSDVTANPNLTQNTGY